MKLFTNNIQQYSNISYKINSPDVFFRLQAHKKIYHIIIKCGFGVVSPLRHIKVGKYLVTKQHQEFECRVSDKKISVKSPKGVYRSHRRAYRGRPAPSVFLNNNGDISRDGGPNFSRKS